MSTSVPILTGKLRLKDETGGTLKSLGSKFKSTFASIGRIAAGVLARDVVRGLVNVGREAVYLGGKLETLQAGFDALTRGIGKDNLSIDTLRKSVKNTVSDIDLLRTANNALALGLPTDQLNDLFESAQIVGNAMGRSTLDAVNDLATGIGRQSIRILDNLGILVDTEAAHEAYALALGKTSNELTEGERKTAFMNFAIKMLNRRAGQLEGTTSELQIAQEALNATWENMKAKIGTALITPLTNLGNAFLELIGNSEDVITAISEGDWDTAWAVIQTTYDETVGSIDWGKIATDLKTWVDNTVWSDVWDGFTGFMIGIWDTIKTAWTTGWTVIWDVLPKTTEEWLVYWDSFKTMMGGFWEWAVGEMDDIDKAFSDWITGTDWTMVKEVLQAVGSDIVTWLFEGMMTSGATFMGFSLADIVKAGSQFGGNLRTGQSLFDVGDVGETIPIPGKSSLDANVSEKPSIPEKSSLDINVNIMTGGDNNISEDAAQMVSTRVVEELRRRGIP